jgi:undecaprenyl-diphosphatase
VNAATALLPIGASSHRLFVSVLTKWPSPPASLLLAMFIGMALAVAVYFWRDMVGLARGAVQVIRGRHQAEAHLLLLLIAASIPIAAAAIAIKLSGVTLSSSAMTIAWLSIAFGLLLYVGDRIGVTVRRLPHMGWGAALLIGCAQALALIPGIGRIGAVVTLARILGFERAETARFALLLTLPVLAAAIALTAVDATAAGDLTVSVTMIAAGTIAFGAGLIAIAWMMAWIEERTFALIAFYRIAAGAAFLAWLAASVR